MTIYFCYALLCPATPTSTTPPTMLSDSRLKTIVSSTLRRPWHLPRPMPMLPRQPRWQTLHLHPRVRNVPQQWRLSSAPVASLVTEAQRSRPRALSRWCCSTTRHMDQLSQTCLKLINRFTWWGSCKRRRSKVRGCSSTSRCPWEIIWSKSCRRTPRGLQLWMRSCLARSQPPLIPFSPTTKIIKHLRPMTPHVSATLRLKIFNWPGPLRVPLHGTTPSMLVAPMQKIPCRRLSNTYKHSSNGAKHRSACKCQTCSCGCHLRSSAIASPIVGRWWTLHHLLRYAPLPARPKHTSIPLSGSYLFPRATSCRTPTTSSSSPATHGHFAKNSTLCMSGRPWMIPSADSSARPLPCRSRQMRLSWRACIPPSASPTTRSIARLTSAPTFTTMSGSSLDDFPRACTPPVCASQLPCSNYRADLPFHGKRTSPPYLAVLIPLPLFTHTSPIVASCF